MPIMLTAEQEAFVTEHMAQAGYKSPQDMIDAAFQLWREQDTHTEYLRREMKIGIDQLAREEYLEYTTPEDLAARVKAEGRRRMGL